MNSSDIQRAGRSCASLLAALALAACGGVSDGDDGAAVVPPASNTAPVATFTAPATIDAGKPLALDARASSDADGDALTYSWSFGDGGIGGGDRIAHLFSAGGSFTVRLTVHDGKGGSHFTEKSVAVTAAPAPMAVVDMLAVVRGIDGPPLSDVTVTLVGGSTVANTDPLGRATLRTGTGVPQLLKFSKAGFSDQFRDATLPASAEDGYVEVTMQPRQAPLTLADAAAGGTLTGQYGAKVTFPAGAIVDAAGNPVSGPVSVSMTPVDVEANVRAFPGRFEGVRVDGAQGLLLSYGTVEYVLSASAAPVQLAPGAKATIEIPVFTSLHKDGTPMKAGDTSPLWSLDEKTGGWIEEGSGTVVVADTPSGFALRADVQHFTWWNHDQFDFPPGRPKPKCLVDTNLDGVFEDLTGTGYCWHGGTGPEQGGAGNPKPERPAEKVGTLAVEPRTVRSPTYAAFASTPAAGGVVLPIPADMNIRFRSYAKNGSLFGTRIVRLGPGVEEEVTIQLTPVQSNDGTRAITLPYSDQFRMDHRGETDRFTFGGTAGEAYQVSVTSLTPDGLTGTVRVLGPSSAVLGSGDFAANGYSGAATATSAGTVTIEVAAQGSAPGGYRIEVRKIAASNCASPGVLALPETRATVGLAADSVTCFNLTLAADDVIDIANTSFLNARGTAALFAPNGERVGIDTFGDSALSGRIQLRAAVAQAGTWRLELRNTRTTAGSIFNLSTARLPVTSTLAVPGSATMSAPGSSAGQSFFYVVKPVPAAREITAALDGKGILQRLRSHPDGVEALSNAPTARVIGVHPALNGLLEITQTVASNAVDFTLTTGVPEVLALDTDIALAATAPGLVKVYRLDASSLQQFTIGRQIPDGSAASPTVRIYSPGGAQIVPTNNSLIYTLTGTGVHTVEVTNDNLASFTGPFTIRVNNARPVEPIALAALTERSATLALGEVQRYSMTVAQAQVLALSLASTGSLGLTAILAGANIYEGGVALAGSASARVANSGAEYAQVAGPVELTINAPSRILGNVTTTSFTVGLRASVPATTALGSLVQANVLAGGLQSYGYNIAAAGDHLLCFSYTGPVFPSGQSQVDARVWGPSALFTNYSGDINGGQSDGNRVEVIGALRAGANTLSVTHSLDVTTPVAARLIAVAAPTTVTVGAAATAGTLTACDRRYHAFAAVAAQSYSVRVTTAFAGTVRVRKLSGPGFHSVRVDPPRAGNLGGTPLALLANVERVVTFTVPATAPFGTGTYIVEVDADDDGTGNYSVSVSTP